MSGVSFCVLGGSVRGSGLCLDSLSCCGGIGGVEGGWVVVFGLYIISQKHSCVFDGAVTLWQIRVQMSCE